MLNRRRIVSALLCSALVAAAPASAATQDLRAPDRQDAAPWTDLRSADVQERYDSSYGDPATVAPEPVSDSAGSDGIAPLPYVLSLVGALIAGMGLASAVRRRHAIR